MWGCGRTSMPWPGGRVNGPKWSKKMKGPTMRRSVDGKARRTEKLPRSRARVDRTRSPLMWCLWKRTDERLPRSGQLDEPFVPIFERAPLKAANRVVEAPRQIAFLARPDHDFFRAHAKLGDGRDDGRRARPEHFGERARSVSLLDLGHGDLSLLDPHAPFAKQDQHAIAGG